MTTNQKESGITKPGYDARKGFAEELIRIIDLITTYSASRQLDFWEMYLRNYYSLTHCYISTKQNELINKGFNDIQEARKISAIRNDISSSRSRLGDNVSFHDPTMVLFSVQNTMFSATAHLLLPSQQDDSEDDFNTGAI